MDKAVYRASPDTTAGPSHNLWHDCKWNEMSMDLGVGYNFQDDFLDAWLEGTQTTQIAWGRYKVFSDVAGQIDTACVIDSVQTPGGILTVVCDTDNDTAALATEAEPFKMSGDESLDGKLWFEARIATSDVTTANGAGFMLGLAENQLWTLAAAVPFSGAAGAIDNSASFIGFHKPEDDLTTIDTVYSDRATSFTKVKDAAVTGLAANTFVKLGMVYDPFNTTAAVTFYKNGTALPDVISRATLQALTNLDVNTLGLIYAQIADTGGTAVENYIDWWRCAQNRV